MNTLIDWDKVESPDCPYPRKTVGEYIDNVRASIEAMEIDQGKGLLTGTWPAKLECQKAALERWGDVDALAVEANRMVSIARSIDDTFDLDQSQRLERFFKDVGGEEHFYLVVEALACSGPLHDIDLVLIRIRELSHE